MGKQLLLAPSNQSLCKDKELEESAKTLKDKDKVIAESAKTLKDKDNALMRAAQALAEAKGIPLKDARQLWGID